MPRVTTPRGWTLWCAVGVLLTAAALGAADGRWKLDSSGNCVYDENDSGPDQCTPTQHAGRWKLDVSGACYFDANDSGPDQCQLPPGQTIR
jgi:hypothetical protein